MPSMHRARAREIEARVRWRRSASGARHQHACALLLAWLVGCAGAAEGGAEPPAASDAATAATSAAPSASDDATAATSAASDAAPSASDAARDDVATSDAGDDSAVSEAVAMRRRPDAGACGLSFEQARLAHPNDRVCATTLYRLDTGYCTFWLPCAASF
jgi:hypothetical protein